MPQFAVWKKSFYLLKTLAGSSVMKFSVRTNDVVYLSILLVGTAASFFLEQSTTTLVTPRNHDEWQSHARGHFEPPSAPPERNSEVKRRRKYFFVRCYPLYWVIRLMKILRFPQGRPGIKHARFSKKRFRIFNLAKAMDENMVTILIFCSENFAPL